MYKPTSSASENETIGNRDSMWHVKKVSPPRKLGRKRSIGKLLNSVKSMNFVERVFTMLEETESKGFDHIVRWEPDGKSFKVYQTKAFEDHIQPCYLNQSKVRSFQRKVSKKSSTSISNPVPSQLLLTHTSPYFVASSLSVLCSLYRLVLPAFKAVPLVVRISILVSGKVKDRGAGRFFPGIVWDLVISLSRMSPLIVVLLVRVVCWTTWSLLLSLSRPPKTVNLCGARREEEVVLLLKKVPSQTACTVIGGDRCHILVPPYQMTCLMLLSKAIMSGSTKCMDIPVCSVISSRNDVGALVIVTSVAFLWGRKERTKV